jgi:hypothetical protein
MVTRKDIENSARKLIGAPWHHQGRSIEAGIDCIGGTIFVGLDTGLFTKEEIAKVDVFDYSRRADAYELLLVKLREMLDEIPISEAREGDILTFRMAGEQITSHVGILVRGQREMHLVHSLETKNAATFEETLRRWKRYATFAFRFRRLEETE